MPQFPPIPTWDSLHPLVIHFPIVLLLLSPLFILISAMLSPPKGRPYMTGALIILLLGTLSLFVASATGEAAATLADRGGAVDAVLAAHEHLASETEIVFTALCVVLVGMVVLPRFFYNQETRLISTFLPLAFLVLYSAGILLVVNTADEGGRLVHEFGVRAMIPAGNSQSHGSHAAGDPSAQLAKQK
jgi:uncharacterized membrane protein